MSLLLWSGGCDSSLLLLQLARVSSEANPLRVISIKHLQITAYEEQKAARAKILEHVKGRGYHVLANELEIKHRDWSERGAQDGIGKASMQPVLWITLAAPYLAPDENLYIGWIQEDSVWHYIHRIRTLFQAIQEASDKTGQLRTPLEWESKADVLDGLKEVGILEICWTCPFPVTVEGEVRSCGACGSCNRHETALWELERQRKRHQMEIEGVEICSQREEPKLSTSDSKPITSISEEDATDSPDKSENGEIPSVGKPELLPSFMFQKKSVFPDTTDGS